MRAVLIVAALGMVAWIIDAAVNIAAGGSPAWKQYFVGSIALFLLSTFVWLPLLGLARPTHLVSHLFVSSSAGWLGGFALLYCFAGSLSGFKAPLEFLTGVHMPLNSILGWAGLWIAAGAWLWLWSRRARQRAAQAGDHAPGQ